MTALSPLLPLPPPPLHPKHGGPTPITSSWWRLSDRDFLDRLGRPHLRYWQDVKKYNAIVASCTWGAGLVAPDCIELTGQWHGAQYKLRSFFEDGVGPYSTFAVTLPRRLPPRPAVVVHTTPCLWWRRVSHRTLRGTCYGVHTLAEWMVVVDHMLAACHMAWFSWGAFDSVTRAVVRRCFEVSP